MKTTCLVARTFCLLVFAAVPFSTAVAQTNLPSIELKAAWPNLKFNRPLFMAEAPDGTHREFVLEQDGKIWILPADRNGSDPKLFLDISDRRPHRENEEGLLAMAFHPQFKTNGKFYIFYTQQGPKRNILSEFQVSKNDAAKADLATERKIFEIQKPYWNHDGATLLFGPDGYLYFGLGDGGWGGDPHDYGENLHVLYSKMLRIDVNTRTASCEYGIPKDNPFVAKDKQGNPKADPFDGNWDQDGVRPEIWAYGLRNPWRMSFDRETGDLWAGDVGQDKFEEVDVIKKGGNYGWSNREGFHSFNKGHRVQGSEPIDPVIEYAHNPDLAKESKFPDHGLGQSITGGYVYRGKKIPSLNGVYVYADFQTGTIWGLRYENGKLTADGELVAANSGRTPASFAEDGDGELYVLSLGGQIYQIVEASK